MKVRQEESFRSEKILLKDLTYMCLSELRNAKIRETSRKSEQHV